MRRWWAGLGLVLVVGGVACGEVPRPPLTLPTATPAVAKAAAAGDPARGRQLYTQSCAVCHAPDGAGIAGAGKAVANNPFIRGRSEAQLAEFIKQGRLASDPANTTKIDMPPRGGNPTLTDADVAHIASFLRTLQR